MPSSTASPSPTGSPSSTRSRRPTPTPTRRRRRPSAPGSSSSPEGGSDAQQAQLPRTARGQRLPPEGRRLLLLPVHDPHRAGVEAVPGQPLHLALVPERLVPLARAAAQDRRGDAGGGDRRS